MRSQTGLDWSKEVKKERNLATESKASPHANCQARGHRRPPEGMSVLPIREFRPRREV